MELPNRMSMREDAGPEWYFFSVISAFFQAFVGDIVGKLQQSVGILSVQVQLEIMGLIKSHCD